MNTKKTFGQRLGRDMKMNWSLYMLMIPVVVYFIMFCYMPMYGIVMAFQDYSIFKGFSGSEWVGFEHFIKFFQSPRFGELLLNTIRISAACLAFGFPAPVVLALLLNEIKSAKLGKVIQNCTYIPHFISLVVACSIIKIFTAETGVIGSFYNMITGSEAGNMLNNKNNFLPIYVISNIWQECGWGSIIYLAALSGIDQSLYEAAEVDGAGKWRKVISITLPSILPTVIIMLIMRMGQILSVGYEKILLLGNDATSEVSDVLSVYNYEVGIKQSRYSYSSAIGLFNTLVNLLFVQAANWISRKVNGYALW
ncbi:MAG: sugar ABC transporter permease [Clostridia bacterium]|nr:sugar ABC transporter permease [Clostridia bacterium]